MKTYLLDIIPKLKRYSAKLDDTTLLTNKHWVVIDEKSTEKTVFIFREKENQLLISTNGKIEKGTWEYLGKNSIIIDKSDGSYLFKHGFADDTLLALKVDGQDKYAILVNEEQFENDLKNLRNIVSFLNRRYLGIINESNIKPKPTPKRETTQSVPLKKEPINIKPQKNTPPSSNPVDFKLNRNGNKWGYIDNSDNLVIEHLFDDAFPFSEGLACVKINGKKGFINNKGEVVIECIFDTATFFNNGKSEVSVGDEVFSIDKNGKRI